MFCKKCGSENLDSAKFCKKCGGQIGYDQNDSLPAKDNKKNITGLLIVGGAIVVVGITLVMFSSRSNSNNSVVMSTSDLQKNATRVTSYKNNSSGIDCGGQVKDSSGISYAMVLAEDGRCWLDRNLGAREIAKAPNDKKSYGWLFQWGRAADGHQVPTSETTSTLSSSNTPGHGKYIISPSVGNWHSSIDDNLWKGVNGKNNPCPTGFRLPTSSELEKLINSDGITDSDTAYNSSLHLTMGGMRNYSAGAPYFQGDEGIYWSSDINESLEFDSYGVHPGGYLCSGVGASVRCIKD